jgi:hypothetical protein
MSTRRTLRVDPVPPVARWETPLPATRVPPALWVPDGGAGGALVGTLISPFLKQRRGLTLGEEATIAAFEDRLIQMHDARTLPPGALWVDAAATCAPKRAGMLDDSWLRRRLNDYVLVKVRAPGG